jgi:hypothetical protein
MLTIPRAPARLRLPIDRQWNGAPSETVRASLELRIVGAALELRSALWQPGAPRIPDARRGTRVANLWEYDVVECFLAGAGGEYLEIELGAGGHFLVLSFSAPRVCSDAYEHLELPVDFTSDSRAWQSRVLLDWSLVPAPIEALNAFVIARGVHLAYAPLPGPGPDFHAPSRFPRAALEHAPGLVRRPE